MINILGYITVGIIAYKLVLFIWYMLKTYVLPQFGFCQRLRDYGKWAVVTGATNGIGKEYAKQLAADGLNVVLISRSKDKLDKVATEIKENYNVDVKVIAYDFTDTLNYDSISADLMHLDIGVLINNVGMSYGSPVSFHECNVERTVQIMNVNMTSDVCMTRMVLNGMIKRQRGAVVHVSSGSIYVTMGRMNVYPATKLFVKKFVDCLELECRGVVDHQILTPMYVESNMSKVKRGFTIPTAKEYVNYAIKTIGVASFTCGYPSHEFLYLLMEITPVFIVDFVYRYIKAKRSFKD